MNFTKQKKYVSKARGFSLVEVLVVVAILGVITTGVTSLTSHLFKERQRNNMNQGAQLAREKVLSLVENADALRQTITGVSALSCLNPGSTTNCSTATINLKLKNPVGDLIFDPTLHGFNWDGNICNISTGNVLCPIRYTLQIKVSCPATGPCKSPAMVTSAKMTVLDLPLNVPINTDRYSFEIFNAQEKIGIALNPLKDGKWHRVFRNTASGTAAEGSVNDLEVHVLAGADFKVTSNTHYPVSEVCAQTYRSGGTIHCLGQHRFAGDAPPRIGHGSMRLSTNGQVWCNNGTNTNGCPVTAEMDWYVRY